MKTNVAVAHDGMKIGWDLCGNPICGRHISITDLDDCPRHPVEPAYLTRKVNAKGRTIKDI